MRNFQKKIMKLEGGREKGVSVVLHYCESHNTYRFLCVCSRVHLLVLLLPERSVHILNAYYLSPTTYIHRLLPQKFLSLSLYLYIYKYMRSMHAIFQYWIFFSPSTILVFVLFFLSSLMKHALFCSLLRI
jgi:hypothetical protein